MTAGQVSLCNGAKVTTADELIAEGNAAAAKFVERQGCCGTAEGLAHQVGYLQQMVRHLCDELERAQRHKAAPVRVLPRRFVR
jgi:hypothetical protein